MPMPISLHAAVVPSMLQILGAGRGWLDKAAASGIAEGDIIDAKLAEDMLPFAYQVRSMADHSAGAIEGVREGVFRPKFGEPLPTSVAEMRAKLEAAVALLEGVSEEELDRAVGQPMRFEIGDKLLNFTTEDFLLSMSQPNFYFHATTAYAILRHKGVNVGKLDYLGALRFQH
jgi:hypothetical protein